MEAEPDNPIINYLADLLSGKDGELTAIHQYFFQQVMTSDDELKRVLKEIAETEMKHAELIADAIVKFGGIPYLCNQYNKWFTTEYVDYALSEKQFLLGNIKDEETNIKKYESIAERIGNEQLKRLLTEIAEDEKEHLEKLKQQLARFE